MDEVKKLKEQVNFLTEGFARLRLGFAELLARQEYYDELEIWVSSGKKGPKPKRKVISEDYRCKHGIHILDCYETDCIPF